MTIERIGDSMESVSKLLERIYDNTFEFSEKAKQDLMTISEQVDKFMALLAGDCSVDVGIFSISLVSHYEKMGDYCFNIATGVNRIL